MRLTWILIGIVACSPAPALADPCQRAVPMPEGATATCSGVLVPAEAALRVKALQLDLRTCQADLDRERELRAIDRRAAAAAAKPAPAPVVQIVLAGSLGVVVGVLIGLFGGVGNQ